MTETSGYSAAQACDSAIAKAEIRTRQTCGFFAPIGFMFIGRVRADTRPERGRSPPTFAGYQSRARQRLAGFP